MLFVVGSVFDLVPDKDKEKLEAVKKMPSARPAGSSKLETHPASASNTNQSSGNQQPMRSQERHQPQPQQRTRSQGGDAGQNLQPIRDQGPLFRGAASGFKPFANNPDKQRRYERYLELRNRGKKCECSCWNCFVREATLQKKPKTKQKANGPTT